MVDVGELNHQLSHRLDSPGHGDKYEGPLVQEDDGGALPALLVVVDVNGPDVVVHVLDEPDVAGDDAGQPGKVLVVVAIAVPGPDGFAGVAQYENVLLLPLPVQAHG